MLSHVELKPGPLNMVVLICNFSYVVLHPLHPFTGTKITLSYHVRRRYLAAPFQQRKPSPTVSPAAPVEIKSS